MARTSRKRIAVYDEGILLVADIDSFNFVGAGVTGTNAGTAITETISGGGGGGFTTWTPTEIPNGSLKVFTFASATAQPSYIISDGVWMEATAKSGTVNWAWNNGTKVATMTIPPTDDIVAVQ